MRKFNDFVEGVKEGAQGLAENLFKEFKDSALDDTQTFLKKAETDLQRWTKLLAAKKINEQDFSDLVHAKKALAEMHALTVAGTGLAKVERFRSALIDLVVDTAFKVFL